MSNDQHVSLKSSLGLILVLVAGWGCAPAVTPEVVATPLRTPEPSVEPALTTAPAFTPAPVLEPTLKPTSGPTPAPTSQPTSLAGPPAPATAQPETVRPQATETATVTPPPTPDFSRGTWRAGAAMPQPARSEMPAVTLGGQIYVPGGFGGPDRLERYDPQTDRWQQLGAMPAERHHLMATAGNDRLYVFGGAEGPSWTPTNTVWQYLPATDQWQALPPMPETRLAGAAVRLGDKIYIAGGAGGSDALLEFWPAQQTWQLLPGPDQPREHVSAVAFQDELWVLGGRWPGAGELASVEIYNPASNTWRPGPTMNVARAGFGAAAGQGIAGQYIIVAGGEVIFNGSETLDSVEILAAGNPDWTFGPPSPIPIHGVGGAALEFKGSFLLLGGSLRAGAIENEGNVQIYEP